MENREELFTKLLNGFFKDLIEGHSLLNELDDKIYFLDTIFELIKAVRTDYDLEFNVPHFVNQKLLSKFRAKMKPFTTSFMEVYFCQAEDCQKLIFKKLQIPKETPFLNSEEYERMLENFAAAVRLMQKSIYLQEEPEPIKLEFNNFGSTLNGDREVKMPWFNRNRQALMFHFLLISEGITRNEVNISDMARFAHILLGWDYTNVLNTELYKRLKNPFNKDNKLLLDDLEFIKTQFEQIQHYKAVELIKKEIASLTKK